MGHEAYEQFRFIKATERFIAILNEICEDYMAQGFTLTVRQLYYQVVARNLFPDSRRWRWTGAEWKKDPNGTKNATPNYKWLADICNRARLAGLLDWDSIEDRARAFSRQQRWGSGGELLNAAAEGFHVDMWENQEYRPYVIIEKDALVGVIQGVCRQYDVPVLAARGYPSGSVLREFVQGDVLPYEHQQIVIVHLGDHDPSGIDMTRDLQRRLSLFRRDPVEVRRIALTMKQIRSQKPPPDPAKETDSRFADYVREYGEESWELDALSPKFLADLVETELAGMVNLDAWEESRERVESVKERMRIAANTF